MRWKIVAAWLTTVAFAFLGSPHAAAVEAMSSEEIIVFGHRNPDTDSVAAAIAAAHLLTATGRPAVATIQGPVSPETRLALQKFGIKEPQLLGLVAGRDVALVDFNDYQQGPEDLDQAKIVFIADHHQLGGIKTSAPLEVHLLPVGSTCTVLHGLYRKHKVPIPREIAGLMLSAILSDTIIYKSKTTTMTDETAGAELAKAAGVINQKALGVELFAAKSAIGTTSADELLRRDYKEFSMHGKKIGIGKIEFVDRSSIDKRKSELLQAMRKMKDARNLHSALFMLTDVMKEGTILLVVTDEPKMIPAVFKKDVKDSEVWLEDVMSRKKDVVPLLEEWAKKM